MYGSSFQSSRVSQTHYDSGRTNNSCIRCRSRPHFKSIKKEIHSSQETSPSWRAQWRWSGNRTRGTSVFERLRKRPSKKNVHSAGQTRTERPTDGPSVSRTDAVIHGPGAGRGDGHVPGSVCQCVSAQPGCRRQQSSEYRLHDRAVIGSHAPRDSAEEGYCGPPCHSAASNDGGLEPSTTTATTIATTKAAATVPSTTTATTTNSTTTNAISAAAATAPIRLPVSARKQQRLLHHSFPALARAGPADDEQ